MTKLNTLAVLARMHGLVTDETVARRKRFEFRDIRRGERTTEGGAIICDMFIEWTVKDVDPKKDGISFWVRWATDAAGQRLPPSFVIHDDYWHGILHVPEVLFLFAKAGELVEREGHAVLTPAVLAAALLDLGYEHFVHPTKSAPIKVGPHAVGTALAVAVREEAATLRTRDENASVGFVYREHRMTKQWRPSQTYASLRIGYFKGRGRPSSEMLFRWRPMDDVEDEIDLYDLTMSLVMDATQWRSLPIFHEVLTVMAKLGQAVEARDHRIHPKEFRAEIQRLDLVDRTHRKYRR